MSHLQSLPANALHLTHSDARGIRQQLESLEQQVQQLRQCIDPDPSGGHSSTPDVIEPVSYGKLRAIMKARRARDIYFDGGLFSDPAWDMLLALFAADLAQQRVTISPLCEAAGVPATTALRWIRVLEHHGLIERRNDPLDRRRVFVALTDAARHSLRAYFSEEIVLT